MDDKIAMLTERMEMLTM